MLQIVKYAISFVKNSGGSLHSWKDINKDAKRDVLKNDWLMHAA